MIAVSALGVPLLFVSYVAEIDPVEIWFVVPSLGVLVVGAALGAGFALAFGPMVSDALARVCHRRSRALRCSARRCWRR